MRKTLFIIIGVLLLTGCTMDTPSSQSSGSQQQTASPVYEVVKLWEYKVEGGYTPEIVDISNNAEYIVVGTDGGLYLLDKDGELVWKRAEIEVSSFLRDKVKITSNGRYVSVKYNVKALILDTEDNSILWSDTDQYKSQKDIDTSEDNRITLLSEEHYNTDWDVWEGLIYLYDGEERWNYTYNEGFKYTDMTPNGEYIVAIPYSENSLFYFNENGIKLWEYEVGEVSNLQISDNGKYILLDEYTEAPLIDNDKTLITIYDVSDASMKRDATIVIGHELFFGENFVLFDNVNGLYFEFTHDIEGISDMKISPNGNYFVVASDNRNKVYLYEIRKT